MAQISFGFLLLPLQALDMVGPMDILENILQDSFDSYHGAEEGRLLKAPTISFHHISSTLDPVKTTGNLYITPTTTISDCPPLDFLLVGGTSPDYARNLPKDISNFIKAQAKIVKAMFMTCTGGLVVGATGVLDGLDATTNHVFIDIAEQMAPKVNWTKKLHWVIAERDGVKFWSAGGAVAGMDMTAQWVREEFEHGQELLDYSTMTLEYQPRDVHGKVMSYLNGRKEQIVV